VLVARKGDLRPIRHLNIGLDSLLAEALLRSALKNERRLTEEARFHIRQGLGLDAAPAEEEVDVPA
jgi:hypothetical protein